MTTSQAVNLLRRIPFLRSFDDPDLVLIAEELERQELDPNETVLRQGEWVKDLWLILQGEVQVTRKDKEDSWTIERLGPGDTIGEVELLYREPSYASYSALKSSSLFRWKQNALEGFIAGRPQAVQDLKFTAKSRRLAQRHPFSWLGENEVVHGQARKHPAILVRSLLLPLFIVGFALVLFAWGFRDLTTWMMWIGGFLSLLGVIFGVWRWIDWGNDFYIVTNRRAVWSEKIIGLYDSQQEAPLHMVLSVSISTGVLGRALNYGDVIIRTFTGQLVFRNTQDPRAMAAIIEEHWRRVKSRREKEDRQTLVEAIRKGLVEDTTQEEDAYAELEWDPSIEQKESRRAGLDRWSFEMRFEQDGVITYRKHWAVLLKRIALPSILLLFLVGFLGAQLGGLIQLFTAGNALMVTFVLLLPMILWWLYQYADWVNDLYQITPNQIVDVNKRPLAQEVRKVAPLENILGTEVERRGIFGLLLNYGNTIAEVGTAKFIFVGIYNPMEAQQDIVRAQDAFNSRKQEQDKKIRQEEMVEWLSAYHQETQQPPDDKSIRGEL